jgi:hypothetical protein
VPKVCVKWSWFSLHIQVFFNKLSCASSNCGVVITLYRRLLTSAKNMERVFLLGGHKPRQLSVVGVDCSVILKRVMKKGCDFDCVHLY